MLDVTTLARRLAARPRAFALLDVREAGEAERGHIAGATALPRRMLEFRIASLVPDRTAPIVVYDNDDGRAQLAERTLRAIGYAAVERLAGGLPAWIASGQLVSTGYNVPSKLFGEHVLTEDGVPSIAPEELDAMRAANPDLPVWDVRTPAEFLSATLPGSMSVPGFEMVAYAGDGAHGEHAIVLHCAGRTRSIIATRTLHLLGYTTAVALENGTMGWKLAGRELAPGALRPLSQPTSATMEQVCRRAQSVADAAGVECISFEQLCERRARSNSALLHIFDVRPADAFAKAHIAGAVHAPGGQLIQCTDEYIAVETAEVVLVDDGDARAFIAGYWLRRMGYERVSVLAGGMPAWQAAAGAVVSGPQRTMPLGLEAARAAVPSIGGDELALLTMPNVVIDVGTSRNFEAGHVPGAQWLPRGWLEQRIERTVPPGSTIVITAKDERQAVFAAATLLGSDKPLGSAPVFVLKGGNAGWQSAGGSLDIGAAPDPEFGRDVVYPPYAKGPQEMLRYLEWEQRLRAGAS